MQDVTGDWMPRRAALAELGVKSQTLYAYVSRGRIAARPDPADPRRSLYAAADIERLTRRAPSTEASPQPHPRAQVRGAASVDSNLTLIHQGRPYYRGVDAVALSDRATFEAAVRVLWNADHHDPFASLRPRLDPVLGPTARSRLFAALARRAEEDLPSRDRSATVLVNEAASVLAEVIDAVAGPGPRLYLHQRLARGWKCQERDADLIRRILVLAADHDLNAATLATRVAAGADAPPAAAALAGVAALSSGAIARRLSETIAFVIEARQAPRTVIRQKIEQGEDLHGFGEPSYPGGDPRAQALLDVMDLPHDLRGILVEGEAATGQPPSFALMLALAARRLELPRDGAFYLLLLGRLGGLLAHALDQISLQATTGSPIRARLRYVGPQPGL